MLKNIGNWLLSVLKLIWGFLVEFVISVTVCLVLARKAASIYVQPGQDEQLFWFFGILFTIVAMVLVRLVHALVDAHKKMRKALESEYPAKFEELKKAVDAKLATHATAVGEAVGVLLPNQFGALESAVRGTLDAHATSVSLTLKEHENKIGLTFWNGVHILLSGHPLRDRLAELESALQDVSMDPKWRGMFFDFMARSVSQYGESGLVMVDAKVTEYADFLRRVLEQPAISARANCLVRPYWFVTDPVAQIVLDPREVGGHLMTYRGAAASKRTRTFVVSDAVLAEMLLTPYIDMEILKLTSCPVCEAGGKSCPIHDRENRPKGENALIEVAWFERYVNKDNHVYYVYPNASMRGAAELDDRVYAEDGKLLRLDIRFQFTNLSKGNMSIRWGTKALPYPMPSGGVLRFGDKAVPCYEHFYTDKPTEDSLLRNALPDESATGMEAHLAALSQVVKSGFRKPDGCPAFMEVYLGKFHGPFRDCVSRAIEELHRHLVSNGPLETYEYALGHYQANGVPRVAYCVTYDHRHPELPVRVAQWAKNWNSISNDNI